MYVIKKLPILLALLVSVTLSLLGLYYDYSLRELSYKLVIGIIVFYIFGMILRNLSLNFLLNVLRQSEEKAKLVKEYENKKNKQQKQDNNFNNDENNNSNTNSSNDDFQPLNPKDMSQ